MAKKVSQILDTLVLRNSATAITATTSTTAIGDARLRGMKGGLAQVLVHALDITSGDETYSIQVQGSDDNGTTYYNIGTAVALSATAASVAGVYVTDLDTIAKKMRVTATLGGTTPSLTFSVLVSVPGTNGLSQYQPASAPIAS